MEIRLTMRLATIVVALLGTPPVTQAQTYRYKSAFEVSSAAYVSPECLRRVLRKITEYCIATYPGTKGTVTRGMEAWEARHAFALEYSARLREFLKRRSERGKTAAAREDARQFLQEIDEAMSEAVRAQSEAMIAPIRMAGDGAPAPDRRVFEDLCSRFFEGLEDGSQDLKKKDPQLFAFFEGRRQHMEDLKKNLKKD